MTRKRDLILAGFLALLVCVAPLLMVVISEPPGLTKGNFDRIKYEMTLAEVEAILGKPPDFNDNFASYYGWRHPSGGVLVWISETEGVYRKSWPEDEQSEPPMQKVRRWLKLR